MRSSIKPHWSNSIVAKFAILAALTAMIIVLILAVAFSNIRSANGALEAYQKHTSILASLTDASNAFSNYRYWSTQHALSLLMHARRQALRSRERMLDALQSLRTTEPEFVRIASQELASVEANMQSATEAYVADQRVLGNMFSARALADAQRFQNDVTDLIGENSLQLGEMRNAVVSELETLRGRLQMFAAIGTIAFSLSAIAFAVSIVWPLQRLQKVLWELQNWHLDVSIPRIRTSEIKRFAGGLEELRSALVERQELLNAITTARDEASQAYEVKSAFLATMSHELRTPLNAVYGLVQLMLQERHSEQEQQRRFELISQHCSLLRSLVDDALDISQIERGHFRLVSEVFSPQLLIGETVGMLQPLARQNCMNIRISAPEAPGTLVLGDRRRVQQILINLIGNSIKHSSGNDILVGFEVVDESHKTASVSFMVSDGGVNVSDQKPDTSLGRGPTTSAALTRHHGSSGLGLEISSKIARMMNGEISFHRQGPGTRSTFKASFPISTDMPTVEHGFDEIEARDPLKILVVEDEDINREILTSVLGGRGHSVDSVDTGEEAVHKLQATAYDLVIVDLQLPGISGKEVACCARKVNPEQFLIAMTAGIDPELSAPLRECGFTGLLRKPYSFDQLNAVINGTIQHPHWTPIVAELGDDRAQAILDDFVDGMISASEGIAHALYTGDLDAIRALSHKVSGSAAMMGLDRIETRARDLELAAARMEMQCQYDETLPNLFDLLKQEISGTVFAHDRD